MLKKVLFFSAALIQATQFLAADAQVMIPNSEMNAESPTPVQVIVTDSNGNVTEQEATYDPDTETVSVNAPTGDDASIFFPLLGLGYLWWDGNWVNGDGEYYENNRWVHIDNDDWNHHWNNYWNHDWDNHWHNYWNEHHNDANFRYKNNEHWKGHSFKGHHQANHSDKGHGNKGQKAKHVKQGHNGNRQQDGHGRQHPEGGRDGGHHVKGGGSRGGGGRK